jgi:D-sedoheptulose 7-phosphate isomerase
MSFAKSFLDDSITILRRISTRDVEAVVTEICRTRDRGGRLFFCGSGGGAGHASHAACDFRKLADVESYSVTDNVSELTARVNDEGWDSAYAEWLKVSRLSSRDCLFVFSVGGGDAARGISRNLVLALEHAQSVGATIVGVVGRDGGALGRLATASIVVPTVDSGMITPQTEGLQALLWHLIVSHPALSASKAKWESLEA